MHADPHFTCPHTELPLPRNQGIRDFEGTLWSRQAINDEAIRLCQRTGQYYPTDRFAFDDDGNVMFEAA